MNDFINRQTLLDRFRESCNGECGCCEYNGSDSDTGEKCRLIVETPAADVQPVKRGKWILIDNDTVHGKCSECGFECRYYEDDVFGMPFCPNCGAVMREEE